MLAKLHRTGIKTISDCRIEAWVMCLAHWTCGLSALRAGNILGRRLLFIFWRWTHSRRRSPKDAFFSTWGSKGMRFLLSALSLCDVAIHFAGQQLSAAALSGWRLWAEVTSEQERVLLCGFQCPCGAGWEGSSSSLSQLSPLHALGPCGCEIAHTKAIRFEQKECRPWGQKNWVPIVTMSLADWMILGKSVLSFTPHFLICQVGVKKFTLSIWSEWIKRIIDMEVSWIEAVIISLKWLASREVVILGY